MELFSKRLKKQAQVDQPAVYIYHLLPPKFRTQVVMILHNTLGPYVPLRYDTTPVPLGTQLWRSIFKAYTAEIGRFVLCERLGDPNNLLEQCSRYILDADPQGVLDIIEVAFSIISSRLGNLDEYDRRHDQISHLLPVEDAIQLLNRRFQEHNLGYEFVDGRLIKKDNEFIHTEVTEPAIQLLHDAGFRGASDEFLTAHDHYRHGRYKEAMNDALKAFESTIKTICTERKWTPPSTANARKLMEIIFDKGLIPRSLDSSSGALITLMEGIATVRNKNSGHGQGETPTPVPEYLAAYMLHLMGANIVLLVKAHKMHK